MWCPFEPQAMDGMDREADFAHVLSLGEQQRVAFVRLLLRRPSIAFLDEATSAVDNKTEVRTVVRSATTLLQREASALLLFPVSGCPFSCFPRPAVSRPVVPVPVSQHLPGYAGEALPRSQGPGHSDLCIGRPPPPAAAVPHARARVHLWGNGPMDSPHRRAVRADNERPQGAGHLERFLQRIAEPTSSIWYRLSLSALISCQARPASGGLCCSFTPCSSLCQLPA